MGFGPFSFGASAGNKSTKLSTVNSVNIIEFSNEAPQLLGLICERIEKFPKISLNAPSP